MCRCAVNKLLTHSLTLCVAARVRLDPRLRQRAQKTAIISFGFGFHRPSVDDAESVVSASSRRHIIKTSLSLSLSPPTGRLPSCHGRARLNASLGVRRTAIM